MTRAARTGPLRDAAGSSDERRYPSWGLWRHSRSLLARPETGSDLQEPLEAASGIDRCTGLCRLRATAMKIAPEQPLSRVGPEAVTGAGHATGDGGVMLPFKPGPMYALLQPFSATLRSHIRSLEGRQPSPARRRPSQLARARASHWSTGAQSSVSGETPRMRCSTVAPERTSSSPTRSAMRAVMS